MVQRLVSFALHQPLFLCLITGLFIAGGIVAFQSLPIEAFPDVTDVQVQIITLFPGHAPEEIEKQLTIPLEIELSGLPHAVRMFSHTQFGLSFIVITFDDKVDDYFARARVLERLQEVSLPPGVQPQLGPLSTPIGEIYRYTLKSKTTNNTDLRSIQDWVVARHLRMIPGVADIVTYGGFIKQYQVSIDLPRMKSYNVSLQQVLTALGRGSANAGGSYIERGEEQLLIRGIGLLRSPEDISSIVVAERNGTPLLIKDIGEIRVSAVPRQGVIGQDDEDDVVTGIVLMRKGENPSTVLTAVKEKVAALNGSILPRDVKLVNYYDRTTLIHTTLHTVFKNLLEGALLVTGILYLFLGNLRAAGIVSLLIPLSLLATFIGLSIRGIPANLLSLGAMDFGIIVDGAVIVVENVFRRLSESRAGSTENARNRILDATVEVGRPTLFSMLIIIIAYIPIFTLQRQEGRIFAPMAYTVVSALVGSLLFSLTLVPLLCFALLRRHHGHGENFIVRLAKRLYEPVLHSALARPWAVIATALVALAGSLAIVPKLGSEFLPELNEGTLWVNISLPPRISLTEASRVCHLMREAIKKSPEVGTVITKAGRPEDGTDPKPVNMVEIFGDLKPQPEWTRKISKQQLIDEIDERIREIPGVNPSFSQPIRDNVLESISQIDGQIVIKVFGDDAATLEQTANSVLAAIKPVRGVAYAAIDRAGMVPQLQIKINRAQAARYGLNVADIEDVIETTLGGKAATEIWEGEKKFDVVVRLGEQQRQDINAIKTILVDTPDGLRIPLEQVADIGVQDGSINISREGGTRVKAVSIFIKDRDMGSLVEDLQRQVKAHVNL
ncbi:MAG TPA: CusA/CzcA family heavy metal efflux RND transporter, partial [Phycisphaerae bacterium]|nr:CusA/CzcA family heavy metal efflux RND transporter [Phycisphaerae bacterium]